MYVSAQKILCTWSKVKYIKFYKMIIRCYPKQNRYSNDNNNNSKKKERKQYHTAVTRKKKGGERQIERISNKKQNHYGQ